MTHASAVEREENKPVDLTDVSSIPTVCWTAKQIQQTELKHEAAVAVHSNCFTGFPPNVEIPQ